jgi:hypothetical protein
MIVRRILNDLNGLLELELGLLEPENLRQRLSVPLQQLVLQVVGVPRDDGKLQVR